MKNDVPESSRVRPIRVPDLGLEAAAVRLSMWLVPTGADLAAGDRVVEILAGPATVDLSAPVGGRLQKKVVLEDTAVRTGQILGWIQPGGHAAD